MSMPVRPAAVFDFKARRVRAALNLLVEAPDRVGAVHFLAVLAGKDHASPRLDGALSVSYIFPCIQSALSSATNRPAPGIGGQVMRPFQLANIWRC